MLWLDSAYPLDKPTTKPGIKRGDCPGGENSTPTYLRDTFPDASVTFKNAAVGEIGSTYGPVDRVTQSPSTTPSSVRPTPPENCIPAGSNCFVKQKKAGCDETSCEQKVCNVRKSCCKSNKKWNKACFKEAKKLCKPCPCYESSKDKFFLKTTKSKPNGIFKTCDWLAGQKPKKKKTYCKKYPSFEGTQSARFVCPVTCNLPLCV